MQQKLVQCKSPHYPLSTSEAKLLGLIALTIILPVFSQSLFPQRAMKARSLLLSTSSPTLPQSAARPASCETQWRTQLCCRCTTRKRAKSSCTTVRQPGVQQRTASHDKRKNAHTSHDVMKREGTWLAGWHPCRGQLLKTLSRTTLHSTPSRLCPPPSGIVSGVAVTFTRSYLRHSSLRCCSAS